MSQYTLGCGIAAALKARGVSHVFGVPGVHNIELYRGIGAAALQHVLARHEQGAGFMADGYARATGRPGVAFVISGPGLTNIMTPMGQAYSDAVPLLVISSSIDGEQPGQALGRLHEMKDQLGAAAAVCDWSYAARDADEAYGLIERAFAEFAAGLSRPRHIQVPVSVLATAAPPPPTLPAAAQRAEEIDTSGIAAMLTAAKRPIFVFGGGAAAAAGPARAVMARSGAAAFTTFAGRGVLGRDTPLNFGAFLARPTSAEVLRSADLVIALGTTLSQTTIWRDRLGHTAPLVVVDTDPGAADLHGARVRVTARAEDVLADLAARLKAPQKKDWSAAESRSARARWRSEISEERPGLAALCDALSAAIPPDTLIYSDMTQLAYVAKEVWDMQSPRLWHHPTGFGTLGYAVPAAIGGAIARPGRPVIAIAGDYGLQYTVQELATAAEAKVPLVILLWDNDGLAEIDRSMQQAQIPPLAVHPRAPDFAALAAAYGIAADQPPDLAALGRSLRKALAGDGPTLIRMTPAMVAGV